MQVFSNRKFPSMIAALKQSIAIYTDDPAWAKVRPPLVELTPEQTKTLAAELKAISFEMELKRKNTPSDLRFTMPGVRVECAAGAI